MARLEQLPLEIPLLQATTFDNFVAGSNTIIVDTLKQFLDNENDWFVYLVGKSGEGRSHLIQAVCHQAEQHNLSMIYLPLSELHQYSPTVLENIEDFDLIAIDDLQCVVGDAEWEEALFNLHNRIQAAGNKLMISGIDIPASIEIKLADLRSRLSAATLFHIRELDEVDKRLAMQQRLQQMGLVLSDEVSDYLLRHLSRNLKDLFSAVDTLDKASLVEKRRLTIPFVKKVLALN